MAGAILPLRRSSLRAGYVLQPEDILKWAWTPSNLPKANMDKALNVAMVQEMNRDRFLFFKAIDELRIRIDEEVDCGFEEAGLAPLGELADGMKAEWIALTKYVDFEDGVVGMDTALYPKEIWVKGRLQPKMKRFLEEEGE